MAGTAGQGGLRGYRIKCQLYLGIPLLQAMLTLIINFALVRSYPTLGPMAHFSRSFLLSLILPALQLALLIAASILHW
jgi:hypothetical protein